MRAWIRTLHSTGWVLAGLALLVGASPDDPWKTKPPEAWSQDEAVEILTDSPWAKTEGLWQATGRRIAVFGNGRTAVYQETPSSPPILYTPTPVRIDPERAHARYTVRWSSSPVVRQAFERLQELSAAVAMYHSPPLEPDPEHYMVTVRVVEPPRLSAADRLSRAQIPNQNNDPLPAGRYEPKDMFAGRSPEELAAGAQLKTNRKVELQAARVVRHGLGAGESITFYFPRRIEGRPVLDEGTEWVEFEFKDELGNKLRARFEANDLFGSE